MLDILNLNKKIEREDNEKNSSSIVLISFTIDRYCCNLTISKQLLEFKNIVCRTVV